jgi:predicted nucleic acid-binding protein
LTLLVDSSVWSLALRRDEPPNTANVQELRRALNAGEPIVSTGLILQEVLQGFRGPKSRDLILNHFAAFPLLVPDRDDYVAAADLRNRCRRSGRQVETIDALLAQLCLRYELTMLSADRVFASIAPLVGLTVWSPKE